MRSINERIWWKILYRKEDCIFYRRIWKSLPEQCIRDAKYPPNSQIVNYSECTRICPFFIPIDALSENIKRKLGYIPIKS